MRPDHASLREILTAGIQAPSAENRHYFRYIVAADRVRLVATDQAAWAALPHRRALTHMAFGAVIENIALKSLESGHLVEVDLRADSEAPELIATLRWSSAATSAPDPLSRSISTRHTNRRLYRRDKVDTATLHQLREAALKIEGVDLRWLDEPALRNPALKAARLAETERFRRAALHAELFGAVRFDVGWHRTVDEWLPPAALEVEPPARSVFAMLRNWRVMRVANVFGAHQALGVRAGLLPCATAPHLGLVLAAATADRTSDIDAGRGFQRLWLAADKAGLALQPMAASTALAIQTPGNGWVAADTQARLQALLQAMRGDSRGVPRMLFRLGHADAPSEVASRKSLDFYLA